MSDEYRPGEFDEEDHRFPLIGSIGIGVRDDHERSGAPSAVDTFVFSSSVPDVLQAIRDSFVVTGEKKRGDRTFLITDRSTLDVRFIDAPNKRLVNGWFEYRTMRGLVRRCTGKVCLYLRDENDNIQREVPCLCDPDMRDCRPTISLFVSVPEIRNPIAQSIWRVRTSSWHTYRESWPSLRQFMELGPSAGKTITLAIRPHLTRYGKRPYLAFDVPLYGPRPVAAEEASKPSVSSPERPLERPFPPDQPSSINTSESRINIPDNLITPEQRKDIFQLARKVFNNNLDEIRKWLKDFCGVDSTADLTQEDYEWIMDELSELLKNK